jgi:hypothetical protein
MSSRHGGTAPQLAIPVAIRGSFTHSPDRLTHDTRTSSSSDRPRADGASTRPRDLKPLLIRASGGWIVDDYDDGRGWGFRRYHGTRSDGQMWAQAFGPRNRDRADHVTEVDPPSTVHGADADHAFRRVLSPQRGVSEAPPPVERFWLGTASDLRNLRRPFPRRDRRCGRR